MEDKNCFNCVYCKFLGLDSDDIEVYQCQNEEFKNMWKTKIWPRRNLMRRKQHTKLFVATLFYGIYNE